VQSWLQEKIFCSANVFDLLQQDEVKQMHQIEKTQEQASLVRQTSIGMSSLWRENTGDRIVKKQTIKNNKSQMIN
jgi:hypothetical protein